MLLLKFTAIASTAALLFCTLWVALALVAGSLVPGAWELPYAVRQNGLWTISVMDVNRHVSYPLIGDIFSIDVPSMSPDRHYAAWIATTGSRLVLHHRDTDSDEILPLSYEYSFSPDSRYLTYRVGNDVYVRGLEAGSPAVRVNRQLVGAHSIVWSPDGTQLAFIAGESAVHTNDIYVASPNGRNLGLVLIDPDLNGVQVFPTPREIVWMRDGQRLALVSVRLGQGQAGFSNSFSVFTVMVEGGALSVVVLTIEASTANVIGSPVDDSLAFVTLLQNNQDIYVVHEPNDTLRPLASLGGEEFHPVWSPDGTRLAFNSREGDTFVIYAASADGSWLRQVTSRNRHSELLPCCY